MKPLKKDNFEEYMKFFKEQDLQNKQSIIIDQLKMLATLSNTMCRELNVDNNLILNKELLDIKQKDYTEDDFAEAAITLICSIQNSLCDFDQKLSDIFDTLMPKQ